MQIGPAQPLIDFLGPSPRTWNKLNVNTLRWSTRDIALACKLPRPQERRQIPSEGFREEDEEQRWKTHHRSVVTALGRLHLCLPVRLARTLHAREGPTSVRVFSLTRLKLGRNAAGSEGGPDLRFFCDSPSVRRRCSCTRERVKQAASDWTDFHAASHRRSPHAPSQICRTHPTLAAPIAIKTGTIEFLALTSPISWPTLCSPDDEWAG